MECVLAMMLAGHFILARDVPGRVWLVAFCLAFALQAALLVMHLLVPGVLPPAMRAVVGASIPALIYLFFARSSGMPGAGPRTHDALHALPSLFLLALVVSPGAGWWIDAAMVAIEAGYAVALLSLNRASGAGGPIRRRALMGSAVFLITVAVLDVLIAFELGGGRLLSASLALQLAMGLLLGVLAAWFVWAWRNPEWFRDLTGALEDAAPPALLAPASPPIVRTGAPSHDGITPDDPEAIALCRRLNAYLREGDTYTEFGLSLAKTARRLSVSAKQLSAAVNRVHGRGFRTLLNDYKVDAAARLLADPSMAERPITEIMFDAGFQTKSNFNKEFGIRKGISPGEYRLRSSER
jgi:AraC-like DNA-binding protein